jgi:galactofuranose transport system permease protein
VKIQRRNIPTLSAAAIMLAIIALGAARYDHFAAPASLANLLTDYGYVLPAAAAATLVILIGGIDLSVGALAAFSGVLMAALVARGWHPLTAAAVCLGAGAALGCAMGALIQRFELPAFMVTLAGMFAVRAAAFLVLAGSTQIQHPFLARTWEARPRLGDAALTWPGVLCLLVLIAAWILARWTPLGQRLYALGGSERSARAMGVPIVRTRIAVYTLAGLCSALAGCALAFDRRAGDPSACVGLELTVIAAVVIGGTLLSGGVGSVLGTLVGVLIIGVIRMIIDFEGTLNAAWTSVAIGALLLAFIVLQRAIAALTLRARG